MKNSDPRRVRRLSAVLVALLTILGIQLAAGCIVAPKDPAPREPQVAQGNRLFLVHQGQARSACDLHHHRESRCTSCETHEPSVVSSRKVKMKVTAFCPCSMCREVWAGEPMPEGVAADYRLLPKGTRLFVPGVGFCTVETTGGAMRKSASLGVYHIDIPMKSHCEAEQWGVQYLDVLILEDH